MFHAFALYFRGWILTCYAMNQKFPFCFNGSSCRRRHGRHAIQNWGLLAAVLHVFVGDGDVLHYSSIFVAPLRSNGWPTEISICPPLSPKQKVVRGRCPHLNITFSMVSAVVSVLKYGWPPVKERPQCGGPVQSFTSTKPLQNTWRAERWFASRTCADFQRSANLNNNCISFFAHNKRGHLTLIDIAHQ